MTMSVGARAADACTGPAYAQTQAYRPCLAASTMGSVTCSLHTLRHLLHTNGTHVTMVCSSWATKPKMTARSSPDRASMALGKRSSKRRLLNNLDHVNVNRICSD